MMQLTPIAERSRGRIAFISTDMPGVELIIEVAPSSDGPYVTGLEVVGPITYDLLRRISIRDLAREALLFKGLRANKQRQERIDALGRYRPAIAAKLAVDAVANGRAPRAEISRSLGVSRSTADRLIRQAKDEGLLRDEHLPKRPTTKQHRC